MTSLKRKSPKAGMSHISLLGATADYELHKSIHICKGIMFLCLLPSSLPGASGRAVSGGGADTAKGVGDFSFKRAPGMSGVMARFIRH